MPITIIVSHCGGADVNFDWKCPRSAWFVRAVAVVSLNSLSPLGPLHHAMKPPYASQHPLLHSGFFLYDHLSDTIPTII